MPRPKPDDRSNNVERLQDHLKNTLENKEEAEDFIEAHEDSLDKHQIRDVKAKNARRQQAVQGFRDEIKDEAHR